MMNRVKQIWIFVLVIVVLLGLTFYWFQYRPAQARIECVAVAKDKAVALLKTKADMINVNQLKDAAHRNLFLQDDYDVHFKRCLSEHGIAN